MRYDRMTLHSRATRATSVQLSPTIGATGLRVGGRNGSRIGGRRTGVPASSPPPARLSVGSLDVGVIDGLSSAPPTGPATAPGRTVEIGRTIVVVRAGWNGLKLRTLDLLTVEIRDWAIANPAKIIPMPTAAVSASINMLGMLDRVCIRAAIRQPPSGSFEELPERFAIFKSGVQHVKE